MENISADNEDNKDHPLKINIDETKTLINSLSTFIDKFINIHTQFYMDLSVATDSLSKGCRSNPNIINTPFYQMINSIKNMFEDYNKTIRDIIDKDGVQKFLVLIKYLNENIKELDNVFFSGENFTKWLSYKNLIDNAHEGLETSIITKYVQDNYKREIKQEQKKEIKDPIKNCKTTETEYFDFQNLMLGKYKILLNLIIL